MALTAKHVNVSASTGVIRKVPGDRYFAQVEITFDNSYVTNGYLIDSPTIAALLGWNSVEMIIPTCMGPSVSAGIGDFSYDQANKKIKLFTAAGVEVANAADASAAKLYCLVFGS